MTSKEKINSIKSVINEFYHDMNCKEKLTECANECWKEYQQFCEDIKQDLERLENLELENISMHDKVAILESENLTFKKIIKEKLNLEKELKQTKLNFRNSQTHSKNCYKKLIDKYLKLEKDSKRVYEDYLYLEKNHHKLVTEYDKLKKVIEILKIYLKLKVETFINLDKTTTYGLNYDTYCRTIDYEVYELLKEYFGNVKDKR